jgi:hypothetical protein
MPLANVATASPIEQLTEQILRLHQEGRFEEGVELAKKLAELSRQQFGAKHPRYTSSLENLALLLPPVLRMSSCGAHGKREETNWSLSWPNRFPK